MDGQGEEGDENRRIRREKERTGGEGRRIRTDRGKRIGER